MTQGHDVIVLDNFFTGRQQNVQHWMGHPSFHLITHDVVEPIKVSLFSNFCHFWYRLNTAGGAPIFGRSTRFGSVMFSCIESLYTLLFRCPHRPTALARACRVFVGRPRSLLFASEAYCYSS